MSVISRYSPLASAASPSEPTDAPKTPMALWVRATDDPEAPSLRTGSFLADFPRDSNLHLMPGDAAWIELGGMDVAIALPDDAPEDVEALFYLLDRDGHWFQRLHPDPLVPGATNRLSVALSANANGWTPVNHYGVWTHRSRIDPRDVGLRLFSRSSWSGSWEVAALHAWPDRIAASPPVIANARPAVSEVALHECFEVRFQLPDRYRNPFDSDEVDAWADITTPRGDTVRVDAFFYQDYYRQSNAVHELFVPLGRPHWRIRYAPRHEGEHRVALHAHDRMGEASPVNIRFRAHSNPHPMPYIRVSEIDSRYFETDDGQPYFPIGHNIRSPFDTRMDEQFPWRFRHPEGSLAYARYFRAMQAAGENITEIWMCAWSLGLEWTPVLPGYHGIGDYNMIHAWELDRVLYDAQRRGIHVNLALNNHGRLSAFCDPEWNDNPMNAANGGYLDHPMDFFDNPRAIADTKQQLRYIVARWGWSPAVFAWKLWNELDLVGVSGQNPRAHQDPRALAWLSRIGAYLKELDPNDHMVVCHLSSDYRMQHEALITIPELDFCPIDAYHGSADPLHIMGLIQQSAAYNNPFGKPVLITEFGGSPMAASADHLADELRVGLWTSTAVPLGGAPMFWWWGVIEEYNLYPTFTSLRRYMDGEDQRDPEMVPVPPTLTNADGGAIDGNHVAISAMASPRQAFVYLARRAAFRPEGREVSPTENWRISVPMPGKAIYRATFWDIDRAAPIGQHDARPENGALRLPIPPFTRDIAFKIHRHNVE